MEIVSKSLLVACFCIPGVSFIGYNFAAGNSNIATDMKKTHCFLNTAVLLATGTLMLLPSSGCSGEAEKQLPMEYAFMKVRPSDVETVEKFPAAIRGRQDVDVYPQISGKLVAVDVNEGQHVRKGQTLFVIDQVPYKAALQTAEANLRSAEAEVASARLDYEGKKALFDEKVIARFELQKSENALMIARAAQAQAAARVTDARNNLSYTTITSPCDGVVGTIPFRAGCLVGPDMSSPLTVVSDNSEMYVYFSMPEDRVTELVRAYGSSEKVLQSMPPVSLYLNDGSAYETEGRVAAISGVLEKNTGTASLRAVFNNPDGLLRSGGAGSVGLKKNRKGVIRIPQSATYELQDKVYACRFADGKVHTVQLKVEAVKESNSYVVLSGLKPGDVIITEGVGNLQDGEAVKLKDNKK